MAQQTAVEWLALRYHHRQGYLSQEDIQKATQMEKEQYIRDYNAGYADVQCNHINDAENYANEQAYQHPDPSYNETYKNK